MFQSFLDHPPEDMTIVGKTAKYHSQGFYKRIVSGLYSIFHQGDINHVTGDIHFLTLFLTGKKTVLTIHDVGFAYHPVKWKQYLIRLFWLHLPIRKVAFVTVISKYTEQELKKLVHTHHEKIRFIPDFPNPEFKYTPKAFNDIKPVIIHIGAYHNLERTVEAIKDIHCTFILVGKPTSKQLKLMQHHLQDFECKYDLSVKELYEEYAKADIISFVSLYEGFGLPIIEGNAVGRPVITGNNHSMPEVSANAACMVNPRSVEEITQGFQKIIHDANYRENLVANGLKNVETYDPFITMNKYYDLYRQILKTS